MLLHLPIAILATLSSVGVSDVVPQFDISKECRFEGGSTAIFDRCSRDEAEALRQLHAEWSQFAGTSKNACLAEASVGGFKSYVELIICLEMGRDVGPKANSRSSLAGHSTPPAQPDMSVVDKGD